MASQVKLTLRPPPNVDFVHGYPGIPPALDRPQAAVKGAVEVRGPPAGIKAKWVRVELRKVETLPGGGQSNTFYDFVGPSPVTLWDSGESDYTPLFTKDFPFSIRIPESIPPSIALENRAGINYELVASVCTKGKKGFLRSRKSVVVSSSAPITIDKHELHSIWPVYCQSDIREVSQEGVTLQIERSNSCFGPGDRVSVFATVKSDAMHTVILRGFDMVLKETVVFRGSNLGRKNNAPVTKVGIVDEGKLAVNATLYGGTQHRSELAVNISPRHATTTLNAARHIDITYVLTVKALLGSGTHLVLDIPVIVSNWQRTVSQEAIRRIGPAHSLSLTPPAPSPASATFAGRPNPPLVAYNQPGTMPAGNGQARGADEMGRVDPRPSPSVQPSSSTFPPNGDARLPRAEETSRRPRTGGSTRSQSNANRFTIVNAVERELSDPGEPKPKKPFLSAEDEKKKLYEQARAKVDRVQGIQGRAGGSNAPASSASPAPSTTERPQRSDSNRKQTPWPTAEEEKTRLFAKAKATAQRNQSQAQAQSLKSPSDTDLKEAFASSSTSAAASGSGSGSGSSALYPSHVANAPRKQSNPSKPRSYPTAEQEKEAMRYREAKLAVDRIQQQSLTSGLSSSAASYTESLRDRSDSAPGPVPYGSVYPNGDVLPTFEASSSSSSKPSSALEEKERLRRAYEARDREASVPAYSPAPLSNNAYTNGIDSALSEKEKLRRRFEAQDAEALGRVAPLQPTRTQTPPQSPPRPPPPRGNSMLDSGESRSSRPPPPTPANGRVLSALEEKALLKAKYAEEDKREEAPPYVNGTTYSSSIAPPPLAPRPPADYIKETQEEDARVSKFISSGSIALEDDATAHSDATNGLIPPPPLPPKPVGADTP